MNILGIKDARFIEETGTLIDMVLETDEGDLPFTYNPIDDAPATEYVRGNLGTFPVAPYVPPTPPTLDELKAAKRTEIASARWNDESSPFYYGPKLATFDTSERSQIKYLRAYEKGDTVMWKTVDAGWVKMSQADFSGLIGAYEAFVASLFEKEAMLQWQITEAETEEDIDRINWEEE
jgi:hypothetical protein